MTQQLLTQNYITALLKVLRYIDFFPSEFKIHTQGRRGGYLSILDIQTGQMVCTVSVGIFPIWKDQRYRMLSAEKAYRLYRNLPLGHITSGQSADDKFCRYDGAIKTKRYILSFSGLSSGKADSTLMVCLAKLIDDLEDVSELSKVLDINEETVDFYVDKCRLAA